MTIAPFKSDQELISFAQEFLRDRLRPFRADVAICLSADAEGHRAEFPALITCIGFVELLSSLYAENLRGNGLTKLKDYAEQFMDKANYDQLRLKILYLVFRHKLAHLSFPHFVFDTASNDEFRSERHRRITWTVDNNEWPIPIELIEYPTDRFLERSVTPWRMSYDCRAIISVPKFQIDIVNSVYAPTGYLQHLQTNSPAQERFAKCIEEIFPPSDADRAELLMPS